jgi:hypothetical protein
MTLGKVWSGAVGRGMVRCGAVWQGRVSKEVGSMR